MKDVSATKPSLHRISKRTHPLPLSLFEPLLGLGLSIRTAAACCRRIPATTTRRRFGPDSFQLLDWVLPLKFHVLILLLVLILGFRRFLLPVLLVGIHANGCIERTETILLDTAVCSATLEFQGTTRTVAVIRHGGVATGMGGPGWPIAGFGNTPGRRERSPGAPFCGMG